MNRLDFHGATITEAAGASVSFSQVTFYDISNVTFDGVDFLDRPGNDGKLIVTAASSNIAIRNATIDGMTDGSGFGAGVGVWVNKTQGFTLENTDITDFSTGFWLGASTGVTVRGNALSNIAWAGMIVGGVHNALFSNNDIDLSIPAGRLHSDGMQFYNSGTNAPSTGVTIEDNVIRAHNTTSHGIYMANAIANGGGGANTFFQDVVIRDNTIVSGDGLGLSWGQTNHLDIHGNIVLRDPTLPADRTTPSIRVHYDATDVSIKGNVTHKAPAGADAAWQPHPQSSAWTIADNHIIAVGTTLAEAQALLDADSGPGNGQADLFRLDAIGPTDVIDRLDFTEGDVIELFGYKGGTFHAQKGGNDLIVTIRGAVLDSMADLHELDAASTAVTIRSGGSDTLVMDIAQPAGIHTIEMPSVAHLYYDVA